MKHFDLASLILGHIDDDSPSVIIIHQIESFRSKRESGSKCDVKSVEQWQELSFSHARTNLLLSLDDL
jgi:hypothetical protein